MKQIKLWFSCFLIFCIAAGFTFPALGVDSVPENILPEAISSLETLLLDSALQSLPETEGLEWTMIGLCRSGTEIPDTLCDAYYAGLISWLGESGGILDAVKYTEYSRVILALTAMGRDPSDANGQNLLLPLGDFNAVLRQGINGPIFALLALDSGEYIIPSGGGAAVQTTRELLVDTILSRQLGDGGFALGGGAGDPDITAMALTALAPYRGQSEVQSATARALDFLSDAQQEDGGFESYGTANSESAAQVLTALVTLGIDPAGDSRFVKDGGTVLSAFFSFRLSGGAFSHIRGAEADTMACQQALCALAAYQRFLNGQSSLYDMTDTVSPQNGESSGTSLLPGKNPDVSPRPILYPDKSFTDIQSRADGEKITELAMRGIVNGISTSLFAPEKPITRAEFAAIVVRALGLPYKQDLPFSDVKDGSWYHDAVATAYAYGIAAGKTQSLFAPSDSITRQEAAVMISRAAVLCGFRTVLSQDEIRNLLAQFDDYTSSAAWSREGLALCVRLEVLSSQELSLRPLEQATRAEVAVMIWNLMDGSGLLAG